MKTVFTIIPDPKMKEGPTIIRQDNPGPDTPAVVVPPSREKAKDGGTPQPNQDDPKKSSPS